MIQVNTTLHTKSNLTIATGSVLDVMTSIKSNNNGTHVTHSIHYAFTHYKNISDYETMKPRIMDCMEFKYNFVYDMTAQEFEDLDTETGVLSTVLRWAQDWLESQVGAANTSVVFPFANN